MKMQAYAHRDIILRQIGFNSYKEYLISNLWLSIRKRALERDKYTCVSCGSAANQVHHKKYSKRILLGGKRTLKHMWSVCGSCHKQCEFSQDGQKLTLRTASNKLRKSIRRRNNNKNKSTAES